MITVSQKPTKYKQFIDSHLLGALYGREMEKCFLRVPFLADNIWEIILIVVGTNCAPSIM